MIPASVSLISLFNGFESSTVPNRMAPKAICMARISDGKFTRSVLLG
jgi:hypothetical protein